MVNDAMLEVSDNVYCCATLIRILCIGVNEQTYSLHHERTKIMKKFGRTIFSACFIAGVSFIAPLTNAAEESTPLGDAVAAKEQAYAKGVTIDEFILNGVTLKQDRTRETQDDFKSPATRKCKPFCVQPETIEGATTIKVEDFPKMAADIDSGKILIVDMRTPEWFHRETIPGSINLPYTDLSGSKTKAKVKMKKLENKPIITFCNGWWCGQSPTGIKALIHLGYTGKIYWFRGGNQDWSDAGLAFVKP
jgi:rhodanese-related sulfurtransferase